LEDTDVDAAWMHDHFGFVVTKYVRLLTKTPKVEGINRKQRFISDMTHLKNARKEIESVKLIDRIDNLQDVSLFKISFLKVYYDESRMMLNMLDRAKPELRDELKAVLDDINYTYNLGEKTV
jgi:(p)ppGpp synthase/HD superfamily hydrolase